MKQERADCLQLEDYHSFKINVDMEVNLETDTKFIPLF